MALDVQPRPAMLEALRTEARAGRRARGAHASWGIVDAILAAIMLPFGVWMFAIDRTVAGIATLFDR